MIMLVRKSALQRGSGLFTLQAGSVNRRAVRLPTAAPAAQSHLKDFAMSSKTITTRFINYLAVHSSAACRPLLHSSAEL
jgi:hypothetical protein